MSIVARAGEALARGLNRRQMLKRAAAATFGAVAAWSVQGFRGSEVLAGHCSYVTSGDCTCNPPYGQYCLQFDESFCEGAACTGGCTYDESYRYVGACWCSAVCEYTSEYGYPMTGHYMCCDCYCYGTQCACREFVESSPEEVEVPAVEEPAAEVPGALPPGMPELPELPPGFPTPPPGFPFND